MKRVSRVQQFASDNYSGICPQAWAAMEQANSGHVPSYGDDDWTLKAADMFRELFDSDCEVFFVFNGTAGAIPWPWRLSVSLTTRGDLP